MYNIHLLHTSTKYNYMHHIVWARLAVCCRVIVLNIHILVKRNKYTKKKHVLGWPKQCNMLFGPI